MSACFGLDANDMGSGVWQGAAIPAIFADSVSIYGFTLLVLCAREVQPSAAFFPGVRVLRAPMDDVDAWPVDARTRTVAEHAGVRVAEEIARGGRALVTCHAGLNRSGLVTGIALWRLTGAAGCDIVRHIRRTRDHALCNEGFARLVGTLRARRPAQRAALRMRSRR